MRYRYRLFNYLINPIFRTSSVLYPSLYQLSTIGTASTDSYEILMQTSVFGKDGESVIKSYLSEFEVLEKELNLKRQRTKLDYPVAYDVADSVALLLYLLVRVYRPETVLETGVANGVSSYCILNALNKNNKGALYSVDINPNVGGLLDEIDRNRWQLKIVNEANTKKEFEKLVGSLSGIDLFVHDSDHSYKAQMHEYKTVYPKINMGGILASDDVDCSYAFVDFCQYKKIKPLFLVTSSKVFGMLLKTVSQAEPVAKEKQVANSESLENLKLRVLQY